MSIEKWGENRALKMADLERFFEISWEHYSDRG
jgi:hypothetical protein